VRKALRDGQSGARYLMSVPGRGYRFVGPLWTTETRKPIEPPASPVESGSGLATGLTRLIGHADAVGDIVERLEQTSFRHNRWAGRHRQDISSLGCRRTSGGVI
jgi:hypothetical protein